MKKLTILLALLTLLSLVFIACDKNDTPATETNAETATDTEAVTTGAAEDATTDAVTTDAVTTDSIDETTAAPSIDDFFSMMESDTSEAVTHAQIEFSATADISVTAKGASQTNSMTAGGSFAYGGDSFALSLTLPGYDAPISIIRNDKLYVSTPDLGNFVCEANTADLQAIISSLMGGDSESEELDPSEIPGLAELLVSLTAIKPSELFASSSLTVDPATGAYTLVMSGLSDKAIQTLETLIALFTGTEGEIELTDDAEEDLSGEIDGLTFIQNILTSWKNSENLQITATFDKEFKLTDLDLLIKADITPLVTSDPEEGTASLSLNMSLDISYEKPMFEAPADADSYELITLDELANLLFGGGMEGEYQIVCGTVANVTTDGEGNTFAVLVYTDYDENWNEIEVEHLVLVPEELVELVTSLKGSEVYAAIADSVLVEIELYVETEVAFATIKDVSTVGGITMLTLTVVVDYDDDGNEILDAMTIAVPGGLVSDVTAIAVGSEVVVEYTLDENGNATLISIDEISFVEDEIAA